MRIENRERQRRAMAVAQNLTQRAGFDFLRRHETRRLDQTQAFHRGRDIDQAFIDREFALDRSFDEYAVRLELHR